MVSKFIGRAVTVFVTMHTVLWAVVMVVWYFAWRVEPAPMGPLFNFSKGFLSRIDTLAASPLDAFSVSAALNIAKRFGADLGLTYAILFGCFVLLAGTSQWYLIARLVQWVAARFGQSTAVCLSGGIACGVSLAFVSWAMSW
jgi:hypothetical protein